MLLVSVTVTSLGKPRKGAGSWRSSMSWYNDGGSKTRVIFGSEFLMVELRRCFAGELALNPTDESLGQGRKRSGEAQLVT